MNTYDFDKTIYDGDSTTDFIIWCIKRKPSLSLRLIPGVFAFIKYLFKLCDKTSFKEKLYRVFAYIPDINQWVNEFWDIHQTNIKAWYLNQQNEDDLIISASPEFLLEPICKRLNITHLLASRVNKKTGEYYGINCHGEEKVRRFKEVYTQNIEEFYSDSYSDTPLAEISKKAFLVKGNNIKKWNF